jgi:hypothetical protein
MTSDEPGTYERHGVRHKPPLPDGQQDQSAHRFLADYGLTVIEAGGNRYGKL